MGEEKEAFAGVLCFYRAADLRPFYKIISFTRIRSEDPPKDKYLYFPLALVRSSVSGGGTNRIVFKKLRDRLREICVQSLDVTVEVN